MPMNFQKYEILDAQAYKHNGFLYRQWNGIVLFDITPEYFLFFLSHTKVKEKNGPKWTVNEPTIWFFPRNNLFFNTIVFFRNNELFFYTNLSSPVFFEDNVFKFIDYDLDIKKYGENDIKILDKNEYAINSKKFKYSNKLKKKINETHDQIINMIKNEDFIFNKNLSRKYIKELMKKKYL